jgi:hypothetical protein
VLTSLARLAGPLLNARRWTCILLAGLLLSGGAVAAEKLVERDVPTGKQLHLQEFGGPDVRIKINAVYPGSIYLTVTDHSRMVPVTRQNLGGGAAGSGGATLQENYEAMMVPTSHSRKIPKKDGKPYDGQRGEMYFLLEEKRSGLKVYLAEVRSTPVNAHTLVIGVPEAESANGPAPVEETTQSAPAAAEPAPKRPVRDFAAWFRGLEETRANLDRSDPRAVETYNQRVEEYHKALKQAQGLKP